MRNPAPVDTPIDNLEALMSSQVWLAWFESSYDLYNRVIKFIDPYNPNFGKAAPPNPVPGLLAYADGTNWNPGSGGAGYYRFVSGTTWTKIG